MTAALILSGIASVVFGAWMVSERWCFGLMLIFLGIVLAIFGVMTASPNEPNRPGL